MHIQPARQLNRVSGFLEMELDLLGSTVTKHQKNAVPEKPGFQFLIVDDNDDMLSYIGNCLLSVYHEANICYTENGNQALKEIQTFRPDLIITDWSMPELDGLSLAARLQKKKETCLIPLLLVTGNHLGSEAQTIVNESQISGILYKPFDAEKLITVVRRILNEHSSTSES